MKLLLLLALTFQGFDFPPAEGPFLTPPTLALKTTEGPPGALPPTGATLAEDGSTFALPAYPGDGGDLVGPVYLAYPTIGLMSAVGVENLTQDRLEFLPMSWQGRAVVRSLEGHYAGMIWNGASPWIGLNQWWPVVHQRPLDPFDGTIDFGGPSGFTHHPFWINYVGNKNLNELPCEVCYLDGSRPVQIQPTWPEWRADFSDPDGRVDLWLLPEDWTVFDPGLDWQPDGFQGVSDHETWLWLRTVEAVGYRIFDGVSVFTVVWVDMQGNVIGTTRG